MTLEMTCSDLMKRLAQVENRCRVIANAAHRFEILMRTNQLIIKLKLEILRFWVLVSEGEFYLEHQGKGYVCAHVTQQEGVSIRWYDHDEGFCKEAFHQSWGHTIFSISEINEAIVEFEREIEWK